MKATLKLQSISTRLHVLLQDQSLTSTIVLAQFKSLQAILTEQEERSFTAYWKSLSDKYLSGPRSAWK